MEVRIKRLSEKAVIPSKAHASDAGFDMVATSMRIDSDHDFIEYGTGLAVAIPEGYVGLIYPRSSLSKYDLRLCNHVAVIDANFLGEIKLRFKADDKMIPTIYTEGERIGQLVVMPIPTVNFLEVDELGSSERGEGSFGSSGS